MSGLPPTPLSERKQSLRSHSKASQVFPSVEEDPESEASSENEGRTHYDLAEEGDVMEGPSESGRVGRGKQQGRESLKITEGIQSTPSLSMPNGMSTPAVNGTNMMTAVDLLTFCQQMMNARQISEHASTDVKREICEYQCEVQASMNMKTVTTFDGTNYQVWKIGILADAEVIDATDILMKNQREPSGLEDFEKERWIIRTKALYKLDELYKQKSKMNARNLSSQCGHYHTSSTALTTSVINTNGFKCDVNKNKIITPEENTDHRRRDKKKNKEDKKKESNLLATQPAAANAANCTLSHDEKQSLIQRNAYNGNLKINTADGGQGHVKEIEDLLESEAGDICQRHPSRPDVLPFF
ncbi:hypothetical protein AJ78_08628 [Emergomyces pasteurianus Ep9510]|uniref:Uncharacterized protein n=1 Tax=Emergomyces pasteurianus Ep9510 TaxID=1447872 RepID=A0A1J9Q225_9EURO|nr:hypothetical protein AJ78_08628 [Emergomyces pasteurianus Ep9510]